MAHSMVTQDSRVTTRCIYSHRTDRRKKEGERFDRNKPPFIAISILFDKRTIANFKAFVRIQVALAQLELD